MVPILECRNLTKIYSGAPTLTTALNGLNFQLEKGKIFGLLGPNGSGKTTLIKTAAGLLKPTLGEIYINGFKPGEESKAMVSYLPDRTYFNDWMKVSDLVHQFSEFYSDFDSQAASNLLIRLKINYNSKLKQLSKGSKEKVQLVLAMSRKAQLYLLDEPIGGVDPAARDFILETIVSNYNKDAAVIISTHLISDVEQILDDFIFLKDGNIVRYGAVNSVREETGKTIDELFREEFKC